MQDGFLSCWDGLGEEKDGGGYERFVVSLHLMPRSTRWSFSLLLSAREVVSACVAESGRLADGENAAKVQYGVFVDDFVPMNAC